MRSNILNAIGAALMAAAGLRTFPALDAMERRAARSAASPFNVIRRDGWSVAQGKRMAKKARNVRRHRAACR